ncbi:unannotated protein [freshwater metagenome]|uniref:Unannotated protein n=1 Tax=freshwater metagenome TaxID=449393 RepID=A0A6J6FEA7_9ZZZZ
MPNARAASISAVSKSPAPCGCRYRWSVEVVQPERANSAKPTNALTCTASSSMARHSGYSDCNHPNNGLSVMGGNARVRFW